MHIFTSHRRWIRIATHLTIATGLLAVNTHSRAQDLEAGLAAHWTFDETAGLEAADASGNANHGILEDFAGDDSQWIEGVLGGAIHFDGGPRVMVPDDPTISDDLAGGFSVSTWFRPGVALDGGGSNAARLLEKGDMFFLLQWTGGGMNFLIKSNGGNQVATIGADLDADTWYHLAGVYDGETAHVFLNGRKAGSLPVPSNDITTLPLYIGGDDATARYNGAVDDLRIYNRPLTDLEAKVLGCPDCVSGPPVFVVQPESTTAFEGAAVSLTIDADGAVPMTFQWFKDGTELTGETGSTLELTAVTMDDAGIYTVVATNGEGSATSDPAELIVREEVAGDLLVHYTLDETGGLVANDVSGNGFNGQLNGFLAADAPWIEAGQVGGALEFAGGHMEVAELPETASTTWAAWVRVDEESPFGAAISATFPGANAGHSLGFHSGDNVLKPRVLWNHATGAHKSIIADGDPLVLGAWNHLAVTFDDDASVVTLYVNGEVRGSAAEASTTPFTSLNLGQRESTQNFPLAGAIDEVNIYDRSLGIEEIAMLMNSEEVTDGLLVQWKLDETAGLIAPDTSGNEHAGSFVPEDRSFWVEGKQDGALNFGAGRWVSVADLPEITSTTWSAWVYLNSVPSFGAAISATFDGAAAGHSLGFHSGATALRPRVLWNHNVGNLSLIAPPEHEVKIQEWNHIAMTYDAATGDLIMYVNKVEALRGNVGTTPFTSLNLGRREASAGTYLDAILDEVRVYNRVLDPAEISELPPGSLTEGPPVFTSHPLSKSVFEGDDVTFTVRVEGLEPIDVQWFKDGEPLPGETFTELILPSTIVEDSGVYHAVATNTEGEATSNMATLEVSRIEREPLGLVVAYDFEDGQGTTVTDLSGNGINGLLMGYADGVNPWVDSQFGFGGALEIVAPGYVEVTLPVMTSMTWATWVRVDTTADFQTVIGADFDGAVAGHILGFRNTPGPVNPRVLWNHGGANTSFHYQQASFELGEWLHEALTLDFDTGAMSLFVNGEKVGSFNNVSTPYTVVNIGRRAPSMNFPLSGAVDNVRIYDVVLSDEEIAQLAIRPEAPLRIASIGTLEADQLQLTISSPAPGREHVVERKDALDQETWTAQTDVVFSEPEGSILTATFPAPAGDAAFYRVSVLEAQSAFFDDFESGEEGDWTHGGVEDNWALGAPANGPGEAFSGANVFATGLDSNLGPFTDSWLRSPEIDLTDVTTATVVLREYRDVSELIHQTVVSTLDAEALAGGDRIVLEELSIRGGSSGGWKELRLPLGEESLGTRIVLEFSVITDQFDLLPGWYLDDVSVLLE